MKKLLGIFPRLVRASAALSVAVFFFTVIFVKQVHAQVDDLAVHFGDELAKVPAEQTLSGAVDGDYYRVSINGANAQVASGVTKSDVGTVLDAVFADCSAHADGMAEDFKDLRHAIQPEAARTRGGAPGFGAVKNQTANDKGYVLCFANGHQLSQLEALERLQETVHTGDLTKIGHIRYVTAHKQPDGTTLVVAVWTDSPFNVNAMFPKEGDAPGSDPVEIARPDGSRRLLTSTVEGAPAAVRIYDVPLSEADAMAFYAKALPAAGLPSIVGSDAPKGGRMFGTPQRAFLVQAANAEPGHCIVTMTESR